MPIFLQPTIYKRQTDTWRLYEGNYGLKSCSPSVVGLQSGVEVYTLDYSDYEGGTAFIQIDPSNFGFTQQATGGSIKIVMTMPATQANIPLFSFAANIKFADFEEIDYWQAGKVYILECNTNNSGTNWTISEVQEI